MKTTLFAAALSAALGTATAAPVFNLQFTPETSLQAQQGFRAAAARWSSAFTDNVTINLTVSLAPLGSGILGQASSAANFYSYQSFRSALAADQTSALDASAVSHLPTGPAFGVLINRTANSPSGAGSDMPYLDYDGDNNNRMVWISNAEAKALSLAPAAQTLPGCVAVCDGFIEFNSNFGFDFDPRDGIDGEQFDFVGVATHEIGHALGFLSGVDVLDFNSPPVNGPFNDNEFTYVSGLDMFRYSALSSASNVIDWTADGRDKFFSIDGGATFGPQFSTGFNFGDGRQASHWKDDLGLGVMDPTVAQGELLALSNIDLAAFDAIGWNLAPIPEPSQFSMFGVALAVLAALRSRKKYFHITSK